MMRNITGNGSARARSDPAAAFDATIRDIVGRFPPHPRQRAFDYARSFA